jgi:hypothetical protein
MNKMLIILSTCLLMVPIFVILTHEGVFYGSASASTMMTNESSTNSDTSTTALVPLKIAGVIASENNNGTNNSGYSIDGNMSSRWSAKGTEWIDVDLGSEQLIKKVDIFWRPGSENATGTRVYSFDLFVINDETGKADYVDLDNKGITHSSILVNEPDGFTGNRVRILGYGNSLNSWNSIEEIKVWGSNNASSMEGLT